MTKVRTISAAQARRLAIARQHLSDPRRQVGPNDIMDVMRDLRYLQIDPMRVVEQSHLLVLWSRLGNYDPRHMDALLWKERSLFQDWAQTTSIVLTEDYPIFSALKRTFATGDGRPAKRIRTWIEKNQKLRDYILAELRRKGAMYSDDFEDRAAEDWPSTGWTKARNVNTMLMFLWAQGIIMIAGRKGIRKLWDLTERHLPEWTPREQLSDREVFRQIAQRSLHALGVATAKQIKHHYIRGCCGDVERVLAELKAEGKVVRVAVRESTHVWSGPWFVLANDQPLLDLSAAGDLETRTTLLSPFDNLIIDRQRTEQLFGFSFRFEVYYPKAKRKYGGYVMPILHGDHLIGRADTVMDRKLGQLRMKAVYAEPSAPKTEGTIKAVAEAIKELGVFLGAKKIVYDGKVPAGWKHLLRETALDQLVNLA